GNTRQSLQTAQYNSVHKRLIRNGKVHHQELEVPPRPQWCKVWIAPHPLHRAIARRHRLAQRVHRPVELRLALRGREAAPRRTRGASEESVATGEIVKGFTLV